MSNTTNFRGFTKVAANSPEYEPGGIAITYGANFDAIDVALGVEVKSTDAAAAAVIASKEGTVILAKASAGAWTLAAPSPGLPSTGGDDGKHLLLQTATAFAHTVTTPANKINGSKHVLTFAAVADSVTLTAHNGVWLVAGTPTAVLS